MLRLETDVMNHHFVALMLLLAVAAICALLLLIAAWSPMKVRTILVPIRERENEKLQYDARVRIRSQRKRYTLVLTALAIDAVALAIIACNSVSILDAVDYEYSHNGHTGLVTDICGYLPPVVMALCVLMLFRVWMKPSPIVRVIMFGAGKGSLVFVDVNNRRFGAAIKERKLRDRKPSDMNHWKGSQDTDK